MARKPSMGKGGVFKKAHELGTVCGDSVIDHYLSGDTLDRTPTPPVMPHREARILELNKEYSEELERLETEKKREPAVRKITEANKSKYWWEWDYIDDSGEEELEILCGALDALKLKVAEDADKLWFTTTHTSSLPHFGYGLGFGLDKGNALY
ncbi:uncharacterized protein LOC113291129 [Papaver somniferum]|uniref:uncharacterized protein LOC113291129 n=1 Tax=Papaver somniferum TaxID=3469 RepID=UPI000E7060C5|nr:uncharacterized protein LOC113291129 [Papaver somniferum]